MWINPNYQGYCQPRPEPSPHAHTQVFPGLAHVHSLSSPGYSPLHQAQSSPSYLFYPSTSPYSTQQYYALTTPVQGTTFSYLDASARAQPQVRLSPTVMVATPTGTEPPAAAQLAQQPSYTHTSSLAQFNSAPNPAPALIMSVPSHNGQAGLHKALEPEAGATLIQYIPSRASFNHAEELGGAARETPDSQPSRTGSASSSTSVSGLNQLALVAASLADGCSAASILTCARWPCPNAL